MNRHALALAAAAAACIAAGEAPEAEPVRAAYAAYTRALTSGDAAAAQQHAIADADHLTLLQKIAANVDVERQFRAAVDKAFPNALPISTPATQPSTWRVKLDGDTATLTPADAEPVKLRRVEGTWKVDSNAMYAPAVVESLLQFGGALRETMSAMTADVAAGKYKTYAELQSDLETRVKMRLASPDSSPTSRPAL